MELLDKFFEKYCINIFIISGIILLIGMIFLGLGKDNAFIQAFEFSMRIFMVLTSLAAIKILLEVLFKRIREWK